MARYIEGFVQQDGGVRVPHPTDFKRWPAIMDELVKDIDSYLSLDLS